MEEKKASSDNFKEGLKGTTLLGGVQVYKIGISVLRSKALAIFLGPAGVGILGLLSSTIEFIYGLTNLGLGTSAIRDISKANTEGDIKKLSFVSYVFKKLVWITGLSGAAICLFLSPIWSRISFHNGEYTFTIMMLSVAVLSMLLSEGQNSLLQGTHNMRLMAKSNVWGNTLGLITTLPLYYFFGIKAIGFAIVLSYLFNLLASWYYSHKIELIKVRVSFNQALQEGKGMIKLGVLIALSGMLTTAVSYIVRVFVSNKGGLSDVGLYTAGFAVVSTYVGMIFTGMGSEYFPRLASYSNKKEEFIRAINEQMQISILLIAPLICSFIIFSRIGILILYSRDFLGIEQMIYLAILAILFKAPSWCCSYAILSKGDSKVFFWTELAFLLVMLITNILLYSLFGLSGLGIAYIIQYIYYLLQEFVVCKKKYDLAINRDVYITYIPHVILCLCCLLTVVFLNNNVRYVVGMIFIICDATISYKLLSKKVDIKGFMQSKIKR